MSEDWNDTHVRALSAAIAGLVERDKRIAELSAELAALQQAWASKVGDGTDKITPGEIVSLIDDYQDKLAEGRSERDRLLAQVQRPWQLFATAPSNGDEILVYRQDAGVFIASFRPSAGDPGEFGPQMNGEECWFDECGGDLTSDLPSHWMPKPPGPKLEEPPHAS